MSELEDILARMVERNKMKKRVEERVRYMEEHDIATVGFNTPEISKLNGGNGDIINKFGMFCPDCGNVMVREGGCMSCYHCGYSKCG